MLELDRNHPTANSHEPSAADDKQLEADFVAAICDLLTPNN